MEKPEIVIATDKDVEDSVSNYESANMAIEAHKKQYAELKEKLDKVMAEKFELESSNVELQKRIDERDEKIKFYEIMNKSHKTFAGSNDDDDAPNVTKSLADIEL